MIHNKDVKQIIADIIARSGFVRQLCLVWVLWVWKSELSTLLVPQCKQRGVGYLALCHIAAEDAQPQSQTGVICNLDDHPDCAAHISSFFECRCRADHWTTGSNLLIKMVVMRQNVMAAVRACRKLSFRYNPQKWRYFFCTTNVVSVAPAVPRGWDEVGPSTLAPAGHPWRQQSRPTCWRQGGVSLVSWLSKRSCFLHFFYVNNANLALQQVVLTTLWDPISVEASLEPLQVTWPLLSGYSSRVVRLGKNNTNKLLHCQVLGVSCQAQNSPFICCGLVSVVLPIEENSLVRRFECDMPLWQTCWILEIPRNSSLGGDSNWDVTLNKLSSNKQTMTGSLTYHFLLDKDWDNCGWFFSSKKRYVYY